VNLKTIKLYLFSCVFVLIRVSGSLPGGMLFVPANTCIAHN
jgi:hypothetical protein